MITMPFVRQEAKAVADERPCPGDGCCGVVRFAPQPVRRERGVLSTCPRCGQTWRLREGVLTAAYPYAYAPRWSQPESDGVRHTS